MNLIGWIALGVVAALVLLFVFLPVVAWIILGLLLLVILIVLFIASLIGVILMFKGDKRGFHIYSIAQICMLINSSVFVYPLQKPSPFFSDLMLTALFILLYYLYFKRQEMMANMQKPE